MNNVAKDGAEGFEAIFVPDATGAAARGGDGNALPRVTH